MISYSATLDVPADTATLLTELLAAERLRRGTGVGARAASCLDQAVLVLRWFREDTPMPTLARDAGVSPATGTCTKASTPSPHTPRTCTRSSRPARPTAGPMSSSTAR